MVCPFTTTLTPYVRSIIFDYRVRLLTRLQCATRAIRMWKVLIVMKRG